MPNTTQLLQMLVGKWDWMIECAALPISAPACRPLWEGVWVAAAAIGAWLLLWVAWMLWKQHRDYDAAIRAQMERERVAEPAVMEQHKFKEAAEMASDVTDPHLAKKIRDELDRQKQDRIAGKKPF